MRQLATAFGRFGLDSFPFRVALAPVVLLCVVLTIVTLITIVVFLGLGLYCRLVIPLLQSKNIRNLRILVNIHGPGNCQCSPLYVSL